MGTMTVSLEPKILSDLLDFLSVVNESELCQKDVLYLVNAWRRYERLWIPLLRKRQGGGKEFLRPPLDVHWMWHLHFLNPNAYNNDLEGSGGILDHSYFCEGPDNLARDAWEKEYFDEPFDAPNDIEVIKGHIGYFLTSFSHDLIEASKRQQDFFYQVSLPHYRNEDFQRQCIQRYNMFLKLKVENPRRFMVPYYDIDLAWHAHMSRPILYKIETSEAFGGQILHHDDSVEREHLSLSQIETMDLWKDKYFKNYKVPGVCHRGNPPNGKLYDCSPDLHPSVFFMGNHGHLKIDSFIYLSLPTLTKKSMDYEISLRVTECHLLGKNVVFERQLISKSSSDLSYVLLFDMKKELILSPSVYSSILFEIDVRRQANSKKSFLSTASNASLKYVAGFYKKIQRCDVNGDTNLKLVSYCKSYQLNIRITPSSESSTLVKINHRVLKILPGSFYDSIIPECIESLWGPIPLKKLPHGQDNRCKAVVHTISDVKDGSTVFTVHLVHSLAQRMSCVQVFAGPNRVSVAHLIDAETLSINYIEAFKKFKHSLWRGMIIKDGYGDWGILVGHWTGVKNYPTRRGFQRFMPGHFSCSFMNLRSHEIIDFKLPNDVGGVFNGEKFSIHIPNKISVNLESGKIIYHMGVGMEVIPYTTLAFSISVLYLLVLPTPRNLDAKMPTSIPEKYQPLYFRSFAPLFFVYCGINSIGSMPANSTIYHKSPRSSFPIMSEVLNVDSNSLISWEEVSVDVDAFSEMSLNMESNSWSGDGALGSMEGFGESGIHSLFMDFSGMDNFGSIGTDAGLVTDGGGFGGDAGGFGGDGGGCGG